MFLTRSKTISSTLNKEQYDNTFPAIPQELISVLQDAIPSINSALKPVVPPSAHELIVNMLSAWIASSSITTSSTTQHSKTKPVTLRSWASRPFLSKIAVSPQKVEISDNSCKTPSLSSEPSVSSCSSLSSIQQDAYTPLEAPICSQLPVSLKSMMDLLDTPPLIEDQKSLSFIEEKLSPLSSILFHDNERIEPSKSDPIETVATAPEKLSENKVVRRSFSTMFNQIGLSVKKVFRKNSDFTATKIKKTRSVQSNLFKSRELSSVSARKRMSYTSLASQIVEEVENVISPLDRPDAKAYAAAFSTFVSTGQVNRSLQDVYGGKIDDCSSSSSTSSTSNLDDYHDLTTTSRQNYYDISESQQFDGLLDDIRERSQEYQDYFAAEETESFCTSFNNHFRNNPVWSPTKVRPSQTEVNMLQDPVPFVCVGGDKRISQRTSRVVNVEDFKAYKKSTSVYSNMKNYDMSWQDAFHEEQKSREKVAKSLKSVSWAFYTIIKRNHNISEFSCDASFDETESTISDTSLQNFTNEPLTEWQDIYDQLAYVFDCGELTAEHAVITFIYVKRMLQLSKQSLWDFSWRMIIMSSLLTAVKVWDDCAIFNADFAMIFPELTVGVINNVERVFLTYLEWDVSVSCAEFAKTYFHLRDIEHMMEQW